MGDFNLLPKEVKEYASKKEKEGILDRTCEYRSRASYQGQLPDLKPDSQARMVFSQPECDKQFFQVKHPQQIV